MDLYSQSKTVQQDAYVVLEVLIAS